MWGVVATYNSSNVNSCYVIVRLVELQMYARIVPRIAVLLATPFNIPRLVRKSLIKNKDKWKRQEKRKEGGKNTNKKSNNHYEAQTCVQQFTHQKALPLNHCNTAGIKAVVSDFVL